jgi:hypothetical protein
VVVGASVGVTVGTSVSTSVGAAVGTCVVACVSFTFVGAAVSPGGTPHTLIISPGTPAVTRTRTPALRDLDPGIP